MSSGAAGAREWSRAGKASLWPSRPTPKGCSRDSYALRHLGPAAVGEREVPKGQYRQQHAHGVVHDAFPAGSAAESLLSRAWRGQDHGGAGHRRMAPAPRPPASSVQRCSAPPIRASSHASGGPSTVRPPDAMADPPEFAGSRVHAPSNRMMATPGQ